MTAPARLLTLRLQGFKSFAERTLVTFGPGISAIVGPNGSGKSNLADALRWALGEQGRALRSRKSEDVIWAGSDRRAAVGMADVQLTLHNADGLLPVDYGVVELGRRLYRSGENEYLLNRQRVRLRDLMDLLDSAHLAENAFLFIGQGMVDQALALRPEERRPLFEEVAGVRRHERRRRRAEEQLVESEANIARIEDVVGELRPQVRRLATQAEQQITRASAGDELVAALLAGAHGRWNDAARRIASAAAALETAHAGVDAALGQLGALESDAASYASALDARAVANADLRRVADEARTRLTAAQLADGMLAAEGAALARERDRLLGERGATEADLAVQRRRLSEPLPARDLAADAALADAERDLAGALAELATLQEADHARDADAAAVRRAVMARAAEADGARRRFADLERQAADQAARIAESASNEAVAGVVHALAGAELERLAAAESAATRVREAASAAWERANAEASAALDGSASVTGVLGATRARHSALAAALEDGDGSGLADRMRARGARRLDEGLVVEPGLQAAVDAALAGASRAYLARRTAVADQAGQRGLLVVVDDPADDPAGTERDPSQAVFRERLTAMGGGILVDAVRRGAPGAVGRLLARAAWVPDLDAALNLQPFLPAGWVAVPRDGSAVVGEVLVRLGGSEGMLARRAELERAAADLRSIERRATDAAAAATAAQAAAASARLGLDAARAAETRAEGERRAAEEAERVAARRLEAALREAAWHAAQGERLATEVSHARAALPAVDDVAALPADAGDRQALSTWRTRVEDLRTRRDRIAAQVVERDGLRRDSERRRAAAEATVGLDESRIAAADGALATLVARMASLGQERDALAAVLAAGSVREAEARSEVAALLAADLEDRARLAATERALSAARDHMRAVEEAARAAERLDLEARLGLEALREQLLVELAGLGDLSLRHLPRPAALPAGSGGVFRASGAAGPSSAEDRSEGADGGADLDDAAGLAAALELAAAAWALTPPTNEPLAPARLATLRRRYHELGATNPYAVEEYATLRARLEDLERQYDDLHAAITMTRNLIAELDAMISEQFRTTFAELETRFDAQFRQLFGGGFAKLSLTDPTDLGSTGIEIVARPPGKKPQALAMLSGGERALTAVALLFAMLEVRPVPFCVLDEVDAALDEANVGRFTTALRELAETTQFVVITHNRGTIEIADALYGVTVGDDSISRVISLRLDEATALAEPSRRPAGTDAAIAPSLG